MMIVGYLYIDKQINLGVIQMINRKSIIAALVCILIITLAAFPALTDDSLSSWAVEQVNTAISEGLVPQNLRSNYTQATTRLEFATLAVVLYEKLQGEVTGRRTFVDTNDVNVQKAASIGIVAGVGDNRFDPDGTLTREQAAVMLSRLADALEKPLPRQAATFADNTQISSWATEGVGHVQAGGIMSGVGNNTFAPQNPYTREQSIVTILRLYDVVKPAVPARPTQSLTVTQTVNVFGQTEHAFTEPPVAPRPLTEESVYNAMMAVLEQYPNGTRWGTSDVYGVGSACAAFAEMLGDAAFGDLPVRWSHRRIDHIRLREVIRPGDILILHADNNHVIMILDVKEEYFVSAEGNYGGTVLWGAKWYWEDIILENGALVASVTVRTRWPE